MKLPDNEKKNLILYLTTAINSVSERLMNLRKEVKYFMGELKKLQQIRKAIK